MRTLSHKVAVITISATIVLLSSISITHAQNSTIDTLRATIKSQIMADPRSKDFSEAQIQQMVDTLTVQAMKQNQTGQNIVWHPYVPQKEQLIEPANQDCGSEFFCSIDYAFGFLGPAYLIPIALLILAILFIFVFSLMREHGHPHAQFVN